MKSFNLFGYKVTIRKIKPSSPHPMDTQAYSRKLSTAKRKATEALKAELGMGETTQKIRPSSKRA